MVAITMELYPSTDILSSHKAPTPYRMNHTNTQEILNTESIRVYSRKESRRHEHIVFGHQSGKSYFILIRHTTIICI